MRGHGTEDDPFPAIVRHLISALIAKPRANLETLKAELAHLPGFTSLRKADLEAGPLAEALTFRLQLKSVKYKKTRTRSKHERKVPATTFIDVSLHRPDSDIQASFEAGVRLIKGVIEWDSIRGTDRDYLIRVVNRDSDFSIRDQILALPSVKSASMSSIEIMGSGIVDNFEADDFLNIKEDKGEAS